MIVFAPIHWPQIRQHGNHTKETTRVSTNLAASSLHNGGALRSFMQGGHDDSPRFML